MGNGTSDGLSDPTGALERPRPHPRKPGRNAPDASAFQPTARVRPAPEPAVDEDVITGALDDDDEPGDGAAAEALSAEISAQPEPADSAADNELNEQDLATAAQESQRAHRPAARQPRKKGVNLKETAVPLFATVGALLLVPGIWAVCILAGAEIVGSDREDAKTMAMVMLAAWPIAGALLAAAWVFWKQVKKQKAALAATSAAKKR